MNQLELSVIIKFLTAAHAVNTNTTRLVTVNVSDTSLSIMAFESKIRIKDIYFKHLSIYESAEDFENTLNVLINAAQGGGFNERVPETTQHQDGPATV